MNIEDLTQRCSSHLAGVPEGSEAASLPEIVTVLRDLLTALLESFSANCPPSTILEYRNSQDRRTSNYVSRQIDRHGRRVAGLFTWRRIGNPVEDTLRSVPVTPVELLQVISQL